MHIEKTKALEITRFTCTRKVAQKMNSSFYYYRERHNTDDILIEKQS